MTKRRTLSSPFLPDNCASDPADSLVLLGLHGRYFAASRLVSVLAFATSLLGAATRQLLRLAQGAGAYDFGKLAGRRYRAAAQRCDGGTVCLELARGVLGAWQVI